MSLRIVLEVATVTRDGRRRRFRRLAANSWLKQMAQFFEGKANNSSVTIKERDGSTSSFGAGTPLDILENAGVEDQGIIVGTGTTAADPDDFDLEAHIKEGIGAGQLEYLACTIGAATAITGGYEVVITRQINNNSGGTINVTEAGMAGLGAAVQNVLWARDVFAAEAIPDGEGRIFRYRARFLV